MTDCCQGSILRVALLQHHLVAAEWKQALMLAQAFLCYTDTLRSFFAQQDHEQVFKFVLSCLDVFQI
jgi:hypothetical protein